MTKIILITGAANGIGKVTAQKARNTGYEVYGLDKVKIDDSIAEYGGIKWLHTHLSKREEVEQAINSFGNRPLIATINNAAEILGSPWEEFNFEEWDIAIEKGPPKDCLQAVLLTWIVKLQRTRKAKVDNPGLLRRLYTRTISQKKGDYLS